MTNAVNDRSHQECQDLLSAAAFGTLTEEEGILLREHLDICPECRRELSELQVIASALPLTLDEIPPSPRLRNRILAVVQHEHRTAEPATITPTPVAERTPADVPDPDPVQAAALPAQRPVAMGRPTSIRSRYLWATAALVLLSLLAGAAIGRFLLAGDSSSDVEGESIAMRFSTPIPNVEGELMYLPDQQVFRLTMENMPAAPHDHVYQVWLIDDSRSIPAGVMDRPEFAVAADRAQYDALAITVEPAPIGSADPTTDPIMIAPLDEAETGET